MKIDSSLKSFSPSTPSSARSTGAKAGGRAESSGGSEVRLSSAAGASSGSPVDSARIAEIKLAIAEGRFKVDANAVADGLLESARQLIDSQRKA